MPDGSGRSPSLRIESLVAGYGRSEVLRGVGLTCAAGEKVAVIGPNGAGKSTLLKAVFGIAQVHAGDLHFADDSLLGLKPSQIVARGVAYVPQLSNVFASLTVEENLEMGAFALGPRPTTPQRIETMFTLFPPLADKRRQPAGELSGGQRQMVALARALMLSPKMLLLDEPSAGLAPAFVETIFARIGEIAASGVGIVLVEQNALKALDLADRAYVLAAGRNVMEGPPHHLLGNAEVAELYLGATTRKLVETEARPAR